MKKYLLGITLLATSGTLLAAEQADQFHAFSALPQATAAMNTQELDSVEGGSWYIHAYSSYSPYSYRSYSSVNINKADVFQYNSLGFGFGAVQINSSYISQY